jgi:hypothetical protein
MGLASHRTGLTERGERLRTETEASNTFQPPRYGLISITVTTTKKSVLSFSPNYLKRSCEHEPAK